MEVLMEFSLLLLHFLHWHLYFPTADLETAYVKSKNMKSATFFGGNLFMTYFYNTRYIDQTCGGSKGDKDVHLRDPIFFIFIQFIKEIGQILGWCSDLWGWRPPVWRILDPPLKTI